MKEFTYTIKDEQGIHARPAGELVKAAAAYPCKSNHQQGWQGSRRKENSRCYGTWCKMRTGNHIKDGWRSGRGSNRSTWQILRGETVRNSSGNRLRRMNQQKDEVTL